MLWRIGGVCLVVLAIAGGILLPPKAEKFLPPSGSPEGRSAAKTTSATELAPVEATEVTRDKMRLHDRGPRASKTARADSGNRTEPASLDHQDLERTIEPIIDALALAEQERNLRVDPRIITTLQTDGQVPVIVAGSQNLPDLSARLVGSRHDHLHHYRLIPFAAVEVGPQALLDLIQTRAVVAIELDQKHRASLVDSVPLIGADVAGQSGFDGTGQAIAILDTGVDLDHPAFAGRIVEEACFSRQGDCPGGGEREFGPGTGAACTFDCGHGTLVAGVALGMDPQDERQGVAPEASLISIQVFSDDGAEPAAWTSDILAGLEHVYDLSLFHSIAVASLSLGGEPYASQEECDQVNGSRKAMIDQLRSVGIATVISSGNEGLTEEISSPACISSAISIGSSRKNDLVSSFSNSAEFLSLLAPGDRISTAREGGGYGMTSGTSIATPHVAGAFAVIREAAPNRSVEEILFALQLTGTPLTDSRNEITTPRLDVQAALEYLMEDPEEPEEPGEPDAPQEPVEPDANAQTPSEASSACGLIGLEVCLPLAWLTWPLLTGSRSPRKRYT